MQAQEYWKKRTERKEKREPTTFAQACTAFLRKKKCKTILDLGCGINVLRIKALDKE